MFGLCMNDSFYTEDTLHRYVNKLQLHAVELFIKLRFVVPATKSVFQPTESLEFLGFVLDSILMRVTITEVKVDKIFALCRSFLDKRFVHYSPRSLPYPKYPLSPELDWAPYITLWKGTWILPFGALLAILKGLCLFLGKA